MDCYRCVRVCPVKAIRITGGYVRVEGDLCIQCGACVHECPQHAKIIMPSTDYVKSLIANGYCVVASIALSFPSVFPGWQSERAPAALRALDFSYVGETAEGAEAVSEISVEQMRRGSIFIACPVVVRYVEQERPEYLYLEQMIAIVSPMIAHARILRERLGDDIKIVFSTLAQPKTGYSSPRKQRGRASRAHVYGAGELA